MGKVPLMVIKAVKKAARYGIPTEMAREIAHYMLAADSPTCRVPYDEVMTVAGTVLKELETGDNYWSAPGRQEK